MTGKHQLEGTLAAIAAPLSMSIGFVLWDKWWQGGSAFSLNLFKAWISSVGFGIVILAGASRMVAVGTGGGTPVPNAGGGASDTQKWWLVLSGFVGIVVGDQAWLLAMQRIGARRVIVVDDVITTGATLREAARAVAAAGGEVVAAATIAATPRRRADRGDTHSFRA